MNNKNTFNKLKIMTSNFVIATKNLIVQSVSNAWNWVKENPEATAAIAVPITVSAIRSGQSLIVSHREKKQIERADLTWYDRSTGLRWDLKRKMTNNDRKAITAMKANGADSIDILTQLNLI